MTSQEIQTQHIEIFKSQRREGIIAKLIMLSLLIIAFAFAYFDLKVSYEAGELGKDIKEDQVIPTIAFASAFFFILLLISKSIKFVIPAKLISARRKYKKEIYNLITSEHPEIVEYLPNQKINPREFSASELFDTRYEDYKGDDWIKAIYREHKIVMCELRVSKLFKNIFNGLFVKCYNIDRSLNKTVVFNHLEPSLNDSQYFSIDTINYIANYCSKYESSICISIVNNTLYIGISRNRNLFERSDLEAIRNLSEDIDIFNSNFEIVKCIVRDLK